MEINTVLQWMSEYGLLFMALIIFLEYMNLPGFPAGIIMPVAGMWAGNAQINFLIVVGVSVIAALLACWFLYFIGWYGGDFLLKKYFAKFPKQQEYIEKKMDYLRKKGNVGVFVTKLIPMARTIMPIPAGVLKLEFWSYTFYSILGIIIWNVVFIGSGYFFGKIL